MTEDPRDQQADVTFSREDYLQHEREKAERETAETLKPERNDALDDSIKHDLGLGDG